MKPNQNPPLHRESQSECEIVVGRERKSQWFREKERMCGEWEGLGDKKKGVLEPHFEVDVEWEYFLCER